MSVRHPFLVTFILILGVVLLSPVGDRLSDLSDAAWWQALPWALLALFWTAIGVALWRQRRREQPSDAA